MSTVNRKAVARARREGIEAREAGVPRGSNPYRDRETDVLAIAWDSAWALTERLARTTTRESGAEPAL